MSSLFLGSYECAVVGGRVMLPESFPVISGPLFYAEIAWNGNDGFCFALDAQCLPDDFILNTPRAAQVRDGFLELPPEILAQAGTLVYIIGAKDCFEIYMKGFPQFQDEDEVAQCITQHIDADTRQRELEICHMVEELRNAVERKSRSRQEGGYS